MNRKCPIFVWTLLLTLSLGAVVTCNRTMNPIEIPYPGYLDVLNSTLVNVINQLTTYKQYIDQAFQPLETYKEVFPKPIKDFEIKLNDTKLELVPKVESLESKEEKIDDVPKSINDKETDPTTLTFEVESNVEDPVTPQSHLNTTIDNEDSTDKSIDETPIEMIDTEQMNSTNSTSSDPLTSLSQEEEEPEERSGVKPTPEIESETISNDELVSLQKFYSSFLSPKENKSSGSSSPVFDFLGEIGKRDIIKRVNCGTFNGQIDEAQPKWNVAIGTNEGSGFQFSCGGILIQQTPSIIIASTSCLLNKKLTVVKLSTNKLHNISAIKLHPSYREPFIYNDIGLVKLRRPLKIEKSVMPCLRVNPMPASRGFPTEVIATDWKFKLRDGSFEILPISKEAKIISNSACQSAYLDYYRKNNLNFNTVMPRGIDSSLICAKISSQIDCQKNAGYQLISKYSNSPYSLMGTSTLSKVNCEFMHLPAIYTNIPSFSSWIRQKH